MYIENGGQDDWDLALRKLFLAFNTAYDRVRGDTSQFLMMGWDARTTLQSITPGPTNGRIPEAAAWRNQQVRLHEWAQAAALTYQKQAKKDRSDNHNAGLTDEDITKGRLVWLYYARTNRQHPRVHISRVKLVVMYPQKPTFTPLLEQFLQNAATLSVAPKRLQNQETLQKKTCACHLERFGM